MACLLIRNRSFRMHFDAGPQFLTLAACAAVVLLAGRALAQPNQSAAPAKSETANAPPEKEINANERQAVLEAGLAKMLSGATLEGSFTVTGPGHDPMKLSREKYTLGEVKKVTEKYWVFPTRIQYGDRDLTLPISLPIEWAADTPVVVVDNLGLPGLGTVSARVMFFADHYAGYWKHGDAGGHIFGVIHRDEKPAAATGSPPE